MLDYCLAHSHLHVIAEVRHVVKWFRLAPLAEVVYLLTPGGSYSEHQKTGGGDLTVLSGEKFDPVIELFEVRKMVNMVGGWDLSSETRQA